MTIKNISQTNAIHLLEPQKPQENSSLRGRSVQQMEEIVASLPGLKPIATVARHRFKTAEELTPAERQFMEGEAPDLALQAEMDLLLGAEFKNIAQKMEEDGIVVLPEFFKEDQLQALKHLFKTQIEKKPLDPVLKQASFNGAVDAANALEESKALSESISDPLLLALITRYMGRPIVCANWRGYRIDPKPSLIYRAWGWHNDQKRKEVKIMILLTDVEEDGQAMRAIPGSHTKWWKMDSQSETKYTFEEAIALGKKTGEEATIRRCYGKAGTVIVFDTNIVHSGYSNESARRDVLSVNYLIDQPEAATFPLGSLHPDVKERHQEDYTSLVLRLPTEEQVSAADKTDRIRETCLTQAPHIQKILQHQPALTQELDTSFAQTQQLKQEYESIPTYSDIKPRFAGSEMTELKSFLQNNYTVDFGPDLDLPVRLGNADVERDIQLVYYRDNFASTKLGKYICPDLEELDTDSLLAPRKVSIQQLLHVVHSIQKVAAEESKLKTLTTASTFDKIYQLAVDFEDSFKRIDSVERLRSTLIYLYAMLVHLSELSKAHAPSLKELARSVLNDYAYVVLHDDLSNNIQKKGS